MLEYVAKTIEQGETIIATLLGMGEKTSVGALFGEKAGAALGGSYLLVTDRRVVIKTGVGTWSTGSFDLKTKTFLYDHIASVDVARRWISGEIEIVSAGMVEKGAGGFLSGAAGDSVVQLEKKYFDGVQWLAARIRELAVKARQPRSESLQEDIPADPPVEQPTKIELTISLKTATALGLTIPQSLAPDFVSENAALTFSAACLRAGNSSLWNAWSGSCAVPQSLGMRVHFLFRSR